MDGLTLNKIFIILVIALFVVGPEKLPHYAQKLGELVKSVKRMAEGAKDRLKEEMGPEFDDVDWKQLDPRQYDPRRIIRDALIEDDREAQMAARKARVAAAAEARRERMKARDVSGVVGAAAGGAAVAEGAATGLDATTDVATATAMNYDDEAT